MINRELRKAVVISYKDGSDAWGQQMRVENSRREIEMTLGLYHHQPVEGPQYQQVNYYGLTKDREIADNNSIEIADKRYKVLFTNPFGRLTEVFME